MTSYKPTIFFIFWSYGLKIHLINFYAKIEISNSKRIWTTMTTNSLIQLEMHLCSKTSAMNVNETLIFSKFL